MTEEEARELKEDIDKMFEKHPLWYPVCEIEVEPTICGEFKITII